MPVPLTKIPIQLFTQLPEYRSPSWVGTVPRELVKDRAVKTWELFHPIPVSRVRGWENIATRLWANILAVEANYDEELALLILKHGSIPTSPDMLAFFGEKFYEAYRGLAFFAGYQDDRNFFRACWLNCLHAILIEEVGAKTAGVNGGWGLTPVLVTKLREYARQQEKAIHVSAVSKQSEALFLRLGFKKIETRLKLAPATYRADLVLMPAG